ncbi:hydrogenase-4 component G [Arcobacter sp. CECT 8983]|uniref:hydrogenase-4 component G n=1 Tax=Arcobacter sp. CECT 8983 TaxID=2044508 RepID=UPI00100A4C7B|nr:hydrogenase-4 component G [Arcobacter sp. CECT 8983]RXJ89060.1 hydrogenase-4 component G [Arcobacter sp. CECT 8983]
MEAVDLKTKALDTYSNNFSNQKQGGKSLSNANPSEEQKNSSIHNSAVNVSISMESMKVFLNIKSVELSQANTNAQNALMNIINNTEIYDFLSGKEIDGGFSLASIGYEGKPITELSPDEAKELVADEGFFGINKTSQRVSSFVIDLAGNDVEALKEARKGIVQGFEEAEKMWGGKLPDISYETQEKTLDMIDKKIEELLKTDTQKELEEGDTSKKEEDQ